MSNARRDIVFVVVADEIGQREAVVACEEVDGGSGPPEILRILATWFGIQMGEPPGSRLNARFNEGMVDRGVAARQG